MKNKNITQKQIDEINKETIEDANSQFKGFEHCVKKLKICPLCEKPPKEITTPCIHWIWSPSQIKKSQFEQIIPQIESQGFVGFNCILRWIANIEDPIVSINDTKTSQNIIEETIKYKNKEWSFQASTNDVSGHPNSSSDFPHYHFQMTINGKIFIKYNNFHFKLIDRDIDHLNARKDPNIEYTNLNGIGIGEIQSKIDPKNFLKLLQNSKDGKNHDFELLTVASAKDDGIIDGNLIADAFIESIKTGESVASILGRNDKLNKSTTIYQGPGIVEKKKRK